MQGKKKKTTSNHMHQQILLRWTLAASKAKDKAGWTQREKTATKKSKKIGEGANRYLRKKVRNGENCNLVMNQQECSKPMIIISFFFSIFSSSFSCWWWWCCTISSIAGIALVTCCHYFLINTYNNFLPSIFCSACFCTSYLMQKNSLLQILQKNIDILKMDVKIPCL